MKCLMKRVFHTFLHQKLPFHCQVLQMQQTLFLTPFLGGFVVRCARRLFSLAGAVLGLNWHPSEIAVFKHFLSIDCLLDLLFHCPVPHLRTSAPKKYTIFIEFVKVSFFTENCILFDFHGQALQIQHHVLAAPGSNFSTIYDF